MRIIHKISEEEANKIAEIRKTIKNKMTDKKNFMQSNFGEEEKLTPKLPKSLILPQK